MKRNSVLIKMILYVISILMIANGNVFALKNNNIEMEGYAYDPLYDNGLRYSGEVILNIDLDKNNATLKHGKEIFDLNFTSNETYKDRRVDYKGRAIIEDKDYGLYLTIHFDKDIKVFGFIEGRFAFNAGNTKLNILNL